MVSILYLLVDRDACNIEMWDYVVVTGGRETPTQVTVYNSDGFVEDLANMHTGRSVHGCGHYVDGENRLVYLVTGGDDFTGFTSSTELLVEGNPEWLFAGPLPSSRVGLRVVSVDNRILATGGSYTVFLTLTIMCKYQGVTLITGIMT